MSSPSSGWTHSFCGSTDNDQPSDPTRDAGVVPAVMFGLLALIATIRLPFHVPKGVLALVCCGRRIRGTRTLLARAGAESLGGLEGDNPSEMAEEMEDAEDREGEDVLSPVSLSLGPLCSLAVSRNGYRWARGGPQLGFHIILFLFAWPRAVSAIIYVLPYDTEFRNLILDTIAFCLHFSVLSFLDAHWLDALHAKVGSAGRTCIWFDTWTGFVIVNAIVYVTVTSLFAWEWSDSANRHHYYAFRVAPVVAATFVLAVAARLLLLTIRIQAELNKGASSTDGEVAPRLGTKAEASSDTLLPPEPTSADNDDDQQQPTGDETVPTPAETGHSEALARRAKAVLAAVDSATTSEEGSTVDNVRQAAITLAHLAPDIVIPDPWGRLKLVQGPRALPAELLAAVRFSLYCFTMVSAATVILLCARGLFALLLETAVFECRGYVLTLSWMPEVPSCVGFLWLMWVPDDERRRRARKSRMLDRQWQSWVVDSLWVAGSAAQLSAAAVSAAQGVWGSQLHLDAERSQAALSLETDGDDEDVDMGGSAASPLLEDGFSGSRRRRQPRGTHGDSSAFARAVSAIENVAQDVSMAASAVASGARSLSSDPPSLPALVEAGILRAVRRDAIARTLAEQESGAGIDGGGAASASFSESVTSADLLGPALSPMPEGPARDMLLNVVTEGGEQRRGAEKYVDTSGLVAMGFRIGGLQERWVVRARASHDGWMRSSSSSARSLSVSSAAVLPGARVSRTSAAGAGRKPPPREIRLVLAVWMRHKADDPWTFVGLSETVRAVPEREPVADAQERWMSPPGASRFRRALVGSDPKFVKVGLFEVLGSGTSTKGAETGTGASSRPRKSPGVSDAVAAPAGDVRMDMDGAVDGSSDVAWAIADGQRPRTALRQGNPGGLRPAVERLDAGAAGSARPRWAQLAPLAVWEAPLPSLPVATLVLPGSEPSPWTPSVETPPESQEMHTQHRDGDSSPSILTPPSLHLHVARPVTPAALRRGAIVAGVALPGPAMVVESVQPAAAAVVIPQILLPLVLRRRLDERDRTAALAAALTAAASDPQRRSAAARKAAGGSLHALLFRHLAAERDAAAAVAELSHRRDGLRRHCHALARAARAVTPFPDYSDGRHPLPSSEQLQPLSEHKPSVQKKSVLRRFQTINLGLHGVFALGKELPPRTATVVTLGAPADHVGGFSRGGLLAAARACAPWIAGECSAARATVLDTSSRVANPTLHASSSSSAAAAAAAAPPYATSHPSRWKTSLSGGDVAAAAAVLQLDAILGAARQRADAVVMQALAGAVLAVASNVWDVLQSPSDSGAARLHQWAATGLPLAWESLLTAAGHERSMLEDMVVGLDALRWCAVRLVPYEPSSDDDSVPRTMQSPGFPVLDDLRLGRPATAEEANRPWTMFPDSSRVRTAPRPPPPATLVLELPVVGLRDLAREGRVPGSPWLLPLRPVLLSLGVNEMRAAAALAGGSLLEDEVNQRAVREAYILVDDVAAWSRAMDINSETDATGALPRVHHVRVTGSGLRLSTPLPTVSATNSGRQSGPRRRSATVTGAAHVQMSCDVVAHLCDWVSDPPVRHLDTVTSSTSSSFEPAASFEWRSSASTMIRKAEDARAWVRALERAVEMRRTGVASTEAPPDDTGPWKRSSSSPEMAAAAREWHPRNAVEAALAAFEGWAAAVAASRLLNCKSGKDRTAMGVTLEEARVVAPVLAPLRREVRSAVSAHATRAIEDVDPSGARPRSGSNSGRALAVALALDAIEVDAAGHGAITSEADLQDSNVEEAALALRRLGVRLETCRINTGRARYAFRGINKVFFPPGLQWPEGTGGGTIT